MPSVTKILLLSIIILFSRNSMAETCKNPVGLWKNSSDATLKISEINDGIITGTFKLSPSVDEQSYNMVGTINAKKDSIVKTVAFAVHWDFLGSVGSWTGYCAEDKAGTTELKMVVHQVRPNVRQENERITTSFDTFKKVKP